jgi:hypothetical protein
MLALVSALTAAPFGVGALALVLFLLLPLCPVWVWLEVWSVCPVVVVVRPLSRALSLISSPILQASSETL